MYISIGVDCWMADFLRKHDLRTMSFPFDWVVTYQGVSHCIETKFRQFLPFNDRINPYHMYFHHDFKENLSQDAKKYERRCQRFLDCLNREEIVFCRKGHACHHHEEHEVTSDLEDAERLAQILTRDYPRLRYRIIVILVCDKCFDPTKTYRSDHIEIYNIATPSADPEKFEQLCRTLFLGETSGSAVN